MSSVLNIQDVIRSQYHAALSMLQQAIEKCPDAIWYDAEPVNRYWLLTFHALFYTHLYLQPDEAAFRPWPKQRGSNHRVGHAAESSGDEPEVAPYTQSEILEYLAFCRAEVDRLVNTLDLSGDSGFSWLPFTKLELQFYNIRHIMQHTGELSGRLFEHTGIEINWVGMQR